MWRPFADGCGEISEVVSCRSWAHPRVVGRLGISLHDRHEAGDGIWRFHMRIVTLFVIAVVLPPVARGQNITASVLGTVSDTSGGSVMGAEVTARRVETNRILTARTDESGKFEIPYLQPGNYEVRVTAAGFKTVVRDNVTLQLADRARLEFALEVGEVTTTVSVSGGAPLVESETSSLSLAMGTKPIVELPLLGRSVFSLVNLAPGVLTGPAFYNRQFPVATFLDSEFSINGGRLRTNEMLLDGVSILVPNNNFMAFKPSVDVTQEFQVLTNNFSAEFGRTGGGVVNITTRGGSNEFHGTVFEFFRNKALNANGWFRNANGNAEPAPFVFNQFGGSLGGPIRSNKTFFYGNYEGRQERQSRVAIGASLLATLPTNLQRSGDFSQTFDRNGALVRIHDPATTRRNDAGTGYIRTQFPNNVIPASRIDPVARNVLTFVPAQNLPGAPFTNVENFLSTPVAKIYENQASVRIDHIFSERHAMFGRFTHARNFQDFPGIWQNESAPTVGDSFHNITALSLNDTFTFTPVLVMSLRYGLTRYHEDRRPPAVGFEVGSLGLPASYVSGLARAQFPRFNFAGYQAVGGEDGGILDGTLIHHAAASATWIHGRHTLKFGGEGRLMQMNVFQTSNTAGAFSFGPNFTQGPDATVASSTSGNAIASFLVGLGGGGVTIPPYLSTQNSYWSGFINDDIKLSSGLTLNLGLRYDLETPFNERFDRLSYLDFNQTAPIPNGTQVRGVVLHAGRNGRDRNQLEPDWNNFGPRIGFAYSVTSKTVIRGGYGLYYSFQSGYTAPGSFGTAGFQATTQWIASRDGVTPENYLSNPLPGGIASPLGAAAEPLTDIGQGVVVVDRSNRTPYIQNFNLNVQRELKSNLKLDVSYAGSRGTRLPQGLEFNQLSPEHLSLGSGLLTQVPNPYASVVTTGSLSLTTVTRGQLLRPFPHFQGVTTLRQNLGNSTYHSLQTRVVKRFSGGVSLLGTYVVGKLIDDGSGRIFNDGPGTPPVQDFYNRRAERAIGTFDVSQRVLVSFNAELPFGKGKALWSGIGGFGGVLLSGWEVNGVGNFSAGRPLVITAQNTTGAFNAVTRPNSTGQSAAVDGDVQSRLTRYFDTSAFTQPAPFTFGNTGRTLADVRGPGTRNIDSSINKRTPITERVMSQFRVEFFNLTNTPLFGQPATGLGVATFGRISAASGERSIQFALKLLW